MLHKFTAQTHPCSPPSLLCKMLGRKEREEVLIPEWCLIPCTHIQREDAVVYSPIYQKKGPFNSPPRSHHRECPRQGFSTKILVFNFWIKYLLHWESIVILTRVPEFWPFSLEITCENSSKQGHSHILHVFFLWQPLPILKYRLVSFPPRPWE